MSDPRVLDLLLGFTDRFAALRDEALSDVHPGRSADGRVHVTATAEPRVVDVRIDADVPHDVLPALVREAVNDALTAAARAAAARLSKLTETR